MCFFETYPTKCQTKNTAPSEQFLNPIPKIVQSEVSSSRVTCGWEEEGDNVKQTLILGLV
jgi:hypothetical protein